MKQTSVIRRIGEEGLRIFSTDNFKKITRDLGLKDSYALKLLHLYIAEGTIRKLYRGKYTLTQSLLSGPPLSEYEIGNSLAVPSSICCWSAFAVHHLTDQVLNTVYVMTTYHRANNSPKSVFEIDFTTYKLIRVQELLYFGFERKFITEVPIMVTDLERTLLDGLIRPQYCGGFREVMEAFQVSWERVNQEKLIKYAERIGKAPLKRIGWVCESLKLDSPHLKMLQDIDCHSSIKLDASRPNNGPWNPRWNIKENI